MKINRIQLGEALLTITLDQFQSVPAEAEIEHTFSQKFQERIRDINKKSKSTPWRVWQMPVKRVVLIAILIMAMLVTVACATPAIRNAIIEFFFVENEADYGITFDPDKAANAPHRIENFYIPTFDPEGYTLTLNKLDSSGVEYIWINDSDEYIYYRQSIIHQDTTDSTWISIDAETTQHRTEHINGYLVEIISNEAECQYVAVWTDNQYIYKVDISVFDANPGLILEAVMNSLTEVETID